ncbi:MAG TPA: hypothetical protein VIX58_11350 [Anaerolineae bacterium]
MIFQARYRQGQFFVLASTLIGLILLGLTACSSGATPGVTVEAGQSVQPTATNEPTVTPIPAPSSTPTREPPTPTPVPPHAIQLTSGGCCIGPVWSPDSKRVLFVDRPGANAPAGLYSVDVEKPLASPGLFTDVLGTYSRQYTYRAISENQQTTIERVADKKVWRIDNNGRNVTFSPDEKMIAWTVQEQEGILADRRSDIYIANIDGTEPRKILSGLVGGGFSGWFPNSAGFLYSWRESRTATERVTSAYTLADNTTREVIRAERIGNTLLSPNGTWLVYTVTLAPNLASNGTFIVGTDGTMRRKLEFFGAMQWRDDNRLLYIPFREKADQSFQLFEYDVKQDKSQRLLDPAATPLFIEGGDWRVAPDGHALVLVSSQDHNLYVVNLP